MMGEYSSYNGLLPHLNSWENMLKELFETQCKEHADTLGMKKY